MDSQKTKSKKSHSNNNSLQNVANRLNHPIRIIEGAKEIIPSQVIETLAFLRTYQDFNLHNSKVLYTYFGEKSFNRSWIKKISKEKHLAYALLTVMEELGSWKNLEEEIINRYGSKHNLEVLILMNNDLEDGYRLQDLLNIPSELQIKFQEAFSTRCTHLMEAQFKKFPSGKELSVMESSELMAEFEMEQVFKVEYAEPNWKEQTGDDNQLQNFPQDDETFFELASDGSLETCSSHFDEPEAIQQQFVKATPQFFFDQKFPDHFNKEMNFGHCNEFDHNLYIQPDQQQVFSQFDPRFYQEQTCYSIQS